MELGGGSKFWRPGDSAAPTRATVHVDKSLPTPVNAVETESGSWHFPVPSQVHLPVHAFRLRFLHLVETHRVVVVTAATGSGKTTQLPQYLAASGWASRRQAIAVVLPTRVAVLAAAARVAQNCSIEPSEIGGNEVGYVLQMQSRRSPGTAIVFFSSAALVAAIRDDPLLQTYSVVMVDDAHERSIATDVLCGMLRVIQQKRGQLRVVISSASLQAPQDFLAFFGGPEAVASLRIPGRMFPVRMFYAQNPVSDYLEAAVEIVKAVHGRWIQNGRRAGSDILVFVPGAEQAHEFCDVIAEWAVTSRGSWRGRKSKEDRQRKRQRYEASGRGPDAIGDGDACIYALPLFASLPAEAQLKALEPAQSGQLKVVAATNVAELSLTIPGVFTVIDCGLQTLKVYSPSSQSLGFATVPISRASAAQRAGRAGRAQAGECFRLYTKEYHASAMVPETPPEILRGDLSEALLMLRSIGVEDVSRFEFIAPPSVDALAGAMARLHSLGALRVDGQLTNHIGSRLADLPIPPHLGRALIAGEQRGVGRLVAAACAMLHVSRSVVVGTGDGGLRARDAARDKFAVAEGDLVTLLNIHRRYVSSQRSPQWCRKHGLSAVALAHAHKLYRRLVGCLRGGGVDPNALREDAGRSIATRICRCFASGLFANLCEVASDGQSYRVVLSGLSGAVIHPSSVLVGRAPRWVVAAEIVSTHRTYLHNVTVVEPLWLACDIPSLFENLSQASH